MSVVEALRMMHSHGSCVKLPEWGGYWHFASDGSFRNYDGTEVEPCRIAKYALRDDFFIVPEIKSSNERHN